MLDELERDGLLANTLVIVTSDHGEEFGEHGLISHGYSLYLPSLRVPLIVVQPGRVPAGRRVAEWVTTRDLAATVLDLVGVDPTLPGRSLRRCWSEAGCGADTLHAELRRASGLPAAFPVSQGDLRSALADPWYYIATATADLLFDLATDSAETRDRARDPSAAAPLEAMRNAVRRGPSPRARADAAGARLAPRAAPVLTRAWR
jgi:arylsulfatase A-like enzyme